MKPNFKWLMFVVVFVAMLLLGSVATQVAYAQAPGCPAINETNREKSSVVGAWYVVNGGTATYYFESFANLDTNKDGVPGLIKYCVYPGINPTNAAVDNTPTTGAEGANHEFFELNWEAALGKFAFQRRHGNPSNISFDGTVRTIGTGTWSSGTAPANQTILLHINDAEECNALYGGNPGTCWVLPGTRPDNPKLCNGDPACKSVVIDEAITSSPLTVPWKTALHIHYTYVLVNNTDVDMLFYPPTAKTQDVNNGGAKDNFGCEQTTGPTYVTQQPPAPWVLTMYWAKDPADQGGACNQSRLTLTVTEPTVLAPGESIVFKLDTTTRVNKGGNQEFTSTGPHILNSGFTAKWYDPDGNMHSFTTLQLAVTVNAVGP